MLAWSALLLVLMPCAAMEVADQSGAIFIVLAVPDAVNDSGPSRRRIVAMVTSGPQATSYEVDVATATLTTPIYGSLRKGRFQVIVPRGAVRIDQPPESYLFILVHSSRDIDFPDMESFVALEAYPVKDGKVCTFRPLKAYAPAEGNPSRYDATNPPSAQRTNCYSVNDLANGSLG
jgi:hypothetical protein